MIHSVTENSGAHFPTLPPQPYSGFPLKNSIFLFVLSLWCYAIVGCRPEKPIEVSYHEKPEYMMLAGILLNENAAWTIKATGSREAVSAAEDEIHDFAQAFDFSNGPTDAKWEAPKSWTDTGESSSIRKATYEINPDSPEEKVTLFVSFFASGRGSDPLEFIAENVNRWRDQMGVAKVLHYTMRNDRETPLPSAELIVPYMTKIPVGANVMYFQRIEGVRLPSGAPPFAGKMGAAMGMSPTPPKPAAQPDSGTGTTDTSKNSPSSKLPFDFSVPDGWTESPAGTFAKLKFKVSETDPAAEVSISFFPPNNSVNWGSTVSMWQGQLNTPKTTDEELEKMTKSIPAENFEVKKIELTGQEKKAGQSLIGAMISRSNGKWFFKLTGKTETVNDQQSNFDSFVNSIKFDAEEKK